MYKKRKIINYLDEKLEIQDYEDPFYDNGLIIDGSDKIHAVALALEPTKNIIAEAKEKEYDLLITHKGIFYKKAPLKINGTMKKKLNLLLESSINYYTAYLPLAMHEEIGAAISISRKLSLEYLGTFTKEKYEIGVFSKTYAQKNFSEILKDVKKHISENIMALNFGKDKINIIGITTLELEDIIYEALEFDLIILPKISRKTYYEAKEYGVNVISINDTALQSEGLNSLKKDLLEKFPKLHIEILKDEELYEDPIMAR